MPKISTLGALRAAVARFDAYRENPASRHEDGSPRPRLATEEDLVLVARAVVELHERIDALEAGRGASEDLERTDASTEK